MRPCFTWSTPVPPGRETRRDAPDRLAPPTGPTSVAALLSVSSRGVSDAVLTIEPCGDLGARTCEVCEQRRSGGHFRIRSLRAPGHRVVCSHCVRGLVEKACSHLRAACIVADGQCNCHGICGAIEICTAAFGLESIAAISSRIDSELKRHPVYGSLKHISCYLPQNARIAFCSAFTLGKPKAEAATLIVPN